MCARCSGSAFQRARIGAINCSRCAPVNWSQAGKAWGAAAADPLEQASRQASADSEVDEILAALDEDPGLYLWLAANDNTLPPPADRRP